MVTAPTSPNLNPLKPPVALVSGGLGEVETLAGALMVCVPSFEAVRKGEGLEEDEKPWKPPNTGFGSAGFSVVAAVVVVWEGAPKPPNVDAVGFSVGAVVEIAGVVAVGANVPNPVGFGSAGLSVIVVVVL